MEFVEFIGMPQYGDNSVDNQITKFFRENPDLVFVKVHYAITSNEEELMSSALVEFKKI